MDKKITVSFKVNIQTADVEGFEYSLKDLLNVSVLPALNADLIPLTFTVRNSR